MEYPVEMKWIIKAENLNNDFTLGTLQKTTIPDVSFSPSISCIQPSPTLNFTILSNDDEEIEAQLIASIPSVNKTYPLQHLISSIKENGDKRIRYWACIGSKYEIMNPANRYIVDGHLTITLRGTIIKKQTLKRKYPFEETSLGSIMWKKSKKDFTLIVGDATIEVHKFVMAERSGYFEAMFNAAWTENEGNQTTVTKFDYPVVEKAIKFCYDFPLIIESVEEAKSLLEFSDYYDIKTLKHQTECFLTEKMSVENVCDIANAAVKANSIILQTCCITFLVKCSKNFTSVNGLDELDADFAKQVLKHTFCVTQKN